VDVREQHERQLKDLQEAYGEAILEIRTQEKTGVPAGVRACGVCLP